jgi:hypothetical protein
LEKFIRYTIITGCLGLFVYPELLLGQNRSSSVVMEVRAEVIAGTSVVISESNYDFHAGQDSTVYAEFYLVLPEGVEFVYNADSAEVMENDEDLRQLNNHVSVEEKRDGLFRFRFYADKNENLLHGSYKGFQTATIEYL